MDGISGGGQAFHLDMESVKYGLISTFKTGNVVLDTLLCCLVPLIVSLVVTNMVLVKGWWDTTGWPFLKDLIFGGDRKPLKPEYTRSLVNRRNHQSFYGSQQQDKTRQLMTAISLYIKTLDKVFKEADVSLVDVEDKNPYQYYYNDNNNDGKDQFANHEILWQPRNGLWIEVDEGVHFMRNDEIVEAGEKEGSPPKDMVTFSFKSTEDDGDKRIDNFLKKAYDWYKADINSRKDNTRYYYSYCAPDNKAEGGGVKYKRFALSDEKDFDAIFFPHKKELLTQLDHFKNKTGRYAIKGSAHKCGLLLHGPPGTGKTSFIKAIARHFNRHIVSIPLARIETNEELIDLMYDLNFKIHGLDYPVRYTYKDCIFVFEDVDAASDVVQRRAPDTKTTTVKITKEVTIRNGGAGHNGNDNSFSGGSIALNALTPGSVDREPSVESTTIVREVSRGDEASKDGEDDDELDLLGLGSMDEEKSGDKKSKKRSQIGPSDKWLSHKDKLNLAGLLEVLDGVVDCPNRLIVMTSNHPEVLDPALVRPGRIDKKIKLDYVAPPEAIEQIEHFLGPMTDKQKERLASVLGEQRFSKVVTPAIVEQASAEFDTADGLIDALQHIIRAHAPHTKVLP